jgi:hypothetical protein
VRRLLPAFLAALACAACAVPIFDPSMSLAAHTLDSIPVFQVTDPLQPPFDGNQEPRFDLRDDALTFLPERIPSSFVTSKGFVIRTHENTSEIWYEWFDGSKVQWMQGSWSFSADDPMPSRWTLWLKQGPYIRTIDVNGTEAYADRLWADTATAEMDFDPSLHTYNRAEDIGDDLLGGSTPIVVGMSVNGAALDGQDWMYALVRIGSLFTEARNLVSEGAFVPWVQFMGTNYPLAFLGTPWRLVYFRDSDHGRSFAQSYDGSTWTSWVWWGTGATDNAPLTTVTHRIDAVLSNVILPAASYLFSAENQVGRVYKYDGTGTATLVAEFALGTLRFIGEASVDGVWKMLFSRCVVDYQNEQFSFEIRAIDTVNLLSTFAP